MTVTRFWTEGKVLDTFDKNTKLNRNNLEMIGKGICMNSNANPKIKVSDKWEQIGNKTECALLEMVSKLGYDFRTVRKQIQVNRVLFLDSRHCPFQLNQKEKFHHMQA